jgi:hypothetical protein
MLYAAAAAWGVLAFATAFDEIPEPVNADVARALTQLGFAMLLIFGLLGAVAMTLLRPWRSCVTGSLAAGLAGPAFR